MQNKSKIQIQAKQLYLKNGSIDINRLKIQLHNEKLLKTQHLLELMHNFRHIVQNQPNVQHLAQPVTVISDIHGQYNDFLKIIAMVTQSLAKKESILFLGDYVDRGNSSIEVITFIMCLKVLQPKNIIILRGNHESITMTQVHGFKIQCIKKYSQHIYHEFMDIFKNLPLCCIVNNRYFCVHGGISQKISKISDLNKIPRFQQLSPNNNLFDLIWADPGTNLRGWMLEDNSDNIARGCSISYGYQTASSFLDDNNLKTIIRGHQVYKQGYRLHYKYGNQNNPITITIFSAPNYCGFHDNLASIMRINNNEIMIRQFKQQQIHICPEQIQTISETLQQLLPLTNNIMRHFINRIVDLYMPQLSQFSVQIILQAFLIFKKCKQSKSKNENQIKQLFIANMKQKIKQSQSQNSNK